MCTECTCCFYCLHVNKSKQKEGIFLSILHFLYVNFFCCLHVIKSKQKKDIFLSLLHFLYVNVFSIKACFLKFFRDLFLMFLFVHSSPCPIIFLLNLKNPYQHLQNYKILINEVKVKHHLFRD